MRVGLLTVVIQLHAIASIKDKRKIVKSLLERLRSRFNCSAIEVDAHDRKLVARLGVAVISNDGAFLNQQIDAIAEFIRQDGRFYVGRIDREVFTAGDDSPLF